MENLDPSMMKALKFDEDFWKKGDKPVTVTTKSGSVYHVDSDGTIRGKMKGNTVDFEGELGGAIYRGGGPIRVGQIVYGMSIEFYAKGNTYTSSLVEKIE